MGGDGKITQIVGGFLIDKEAPAPGLPYFTRRGLSCVPPKLNKNEFIS
jgi:hypothetical protein